MFAGVENVPKVNRPIQDLVVASSRRALPAASASLSTGFKARTTGGPDERSLVCVSFTHFIVAPVCYRSNAILVHGCASLFGERARRGKGEKRGKKRQTPRSRSIFLLSNMFGQQH